MSEDELLCLSGPVLYVCSVQGKSSVLATERPVPKTNHVQMFLGSLQVYSYFRAPTPSALQGSVLLDKG